MLNDQFNQKLRVDPVSGTLGIVYFDTIADTHRKKANLVFQASADQGSTWSQQLAVSSSQSDETNASADSGNQYGDYNGLTVLSNVFYPSWTDHHDTNPEAIFTARISVPAPASGLPQPRIEAIAKVPADAGTTAGPRSR